MKLITTSSPQSRLTAPLSIAVEKWFRHVICHCYDNGSVVIGFVDANGLRHAVSAGRNEPCFDLLDQRADNMVTSEVEK